MKKASLVDAVAVWNRQTARLSLHFRAPPLVTSEDAVTYGRLWDAEIDKHLAPLGWTGVEVEEAILRQ
jgi:hypothetical protein